MPNKRTIHLLPTTHCREELVAVDYRWDSCRKTDCQLGGRKGLGLGLGLGHSCQHANEFLLKSL
eukprot:scaffold3430_cov189-Ochromonas_danica.AAC.1